MRAGRWQPSVRRDGRPINDGNGAITLYEAAHPLLSDDAVLNAGEGGREHEGTFYGEPSQAFVIFSPTV